MNADFYYFIIRNHIYYFFIYKMHVKQGTAIQKFVFCFIFGQNVNFFSGINLDF